MPIICATGDVGEGEARSFCVNGESLIVVRANERFHVYRNRCPHLGIPLEWQPDEFIEPDSELLRCATHGALFLPDTGECISGPCAGDALTAVAFTEVDGKLLLAT